MLTFFRSFFKTKIGLGIALAFLLLIGFAFASMDVSNTATFGGVAGGNRVAVVGDQKIGTADLSQAVTDELDRERQENPTATIQNFLANGGLEQALEQLIARFSLVEWARENGLRAGDNLINSEIRQIPAAAGPSGSFDEASYRAFLARENLTDSRLRELIAASLVAQQAIIPAGYGSTIPDSIARTYARSFKERRRGAVALLPAEAFAPNNPPTDAQLQDFYSENRMRFVRPERRIIQFARIDGSNLRAEATPTDAEIAAEYRRNSAQYAASEERSFNQLIVPTQAAAQAIAQRVNGGQSLAAAAQGGGLRTTQLDSLTRSELRAQASEAVANAYFQASQGSVTAPARSPLGWHIAQVRSIERIPARSLAEVRNEIEGGLAEQKRTQLLSDLAIDIEDQIADGASLSDIASARGADVQSSQPLLASGQVYGQNQSASDILSPIVPVAFQMEEGDPEIAALPGGESYLVYQVSEVVPAATAPLAEIRERVVADWRRLTGASEARKAADRVLARLRNGNSLRESLAQEKVQLPSPDQINSSREELARLGGQQVPAPIALMFGMAEGSAKKLEAPRNGGWFVVDLEEVELDTLADNDPLIAQASRELGRAWGAEYGAQLGVAMRQEVGVERNAAAIDAVRRQLLGTN